MKKFSPWCLAAIASMAPLGTLGGMTGALAGHTVVLAITLGIFVGTLSLNRTPAQRGHSAPTIDVTAEVLDERDAAARKLAGRG